jgi:hypothetical protein
MKKKVKPIKRTARIRTALLSYSLICNLMLDVKADMMMLRIL